jgi:GNAT superfamily N-acetyltransferase
MFQMRPAQASDQQPIARMIHARSTWLVERGLPSWDAAADGLAAQAAEPTFPVWVLTDHDRVIGCTSLFDESPAWFWTEQERAEPAIFMATTVTDPAYAGRRIGSQIAWWALDYAARTGRLWVRRGTTEARLVRYYRDVQGWSVVRSLDRDGVSVTGLARRAEVLPDLLIYPAGT